MVSWGIIKCRHLSLNGAKIHFLLVKNKLQVFSNVYYIKFF